MTINTKKILLFFQKNSLYLAAFFLPFSVMMSIFILQGIYPFGDRSFLHVDMYHQYFPFLTEFYHKLKSGDSLLFSWNTGIGSNFLSLYAYYLASPFNWLCIFVPEGLLIEFQSYMVVLKIGLCGLTCCYYFRHHFHTKNPCLLFFTTFYALSGFMAAYNWNVMWLDVIFLTPLVILGLEQMTKGKGFTLYTLSLSLCILSNFYLSIMLCIYLVLYFLLVLLTECENKVIALRKFALFSLMAGGISAVLLFPELAALSLSEFSGSSFPKEGNSYFALLDVFARHSMDVAVEIGLDHWPNVYAGVSVFVFIPLYVISRTIPSREKMGRLILLAFFIISFSSNALSFLWHGFNFPNSLPSRQSYLYILLLLTVCAKTCLHLKEFSKEELSWVFFGVIVFLILCQKLITDDAFTNRTYLLSACFLLGYGYLLHLYRNRQRVTPLLLFCFLLLFTLEAGLNTYLTSCPTVSRSSYLKNYEHYRDMAKKQQEEAPWVRMERQKRVTNNDGMLYGYPSGSLFSSTMNGLVTSFYEEYGLKSSKVFYSFDGATAFTSALLQVGYCFQENTPSIKDPSSALPLLSENKAVLPFGYVIPSSDLTLSEAGMQEKLKEAQTIEENREPEEPSLYDLTELFVDGEYAQDMVLDDEFTNIRLRGIPLEKQNLLAKKMGAAQDLFLPQEVQNFDISSEITIPEDGYYYAWSLNDKAVSCTAQITSDQEHHTLQFEKMKNRHILDLGYRKAGDNITVTEVSQRSPDLVLYSLNEKAFLQFVEDLHRQPLSLKTFESTKIEGSIEVKEAGYLVFSMAYDPGWRLFIDGKPYETSMLEGLFLSAPISAGYHEILLTYFPKGLGLGVTVSILSMATFLILFIQGRKKAVPTSF